MYLEEKMGRLVIRGIIRYMVWLIMIRVVFVYVTKDPFIDSALNWAIIGSVLGLAGRFMYVRRKELRRRG